MRLGVALVVACVGCDPGLGADLNLVTARDLSGTYTGVLQGVSVTNLDDVGVPERQVIVDVDLLHELRVRATGDVTLHIESDVIPPLRAIVVGMGPVAINADFVEFEGPRFAAVKVKQIVFVQYEGEWIVVMQLIKAGDEIYVYQYVSYPASVAAQMNEDEAIRYVNMILRLVSAAQRRT